VASYRLSVKTISRNTGGNCVQAIAYRSGEKIKDERDGSSPDYSDRKDILHKEIILPDGAPVRLLDRSTLWNEVEASEKRKDARPAREFQLSLPKELSHDERIELTREFVKTELVNRGMCADIAIHDQKNGNENYHAHVLVTTRSVDQSGFGKKNRDWNDKALVSQWRKSWAEIQNKHLEKTGSIERVDHRTLAEQGKTQVQTIHLGRLAHMQPDKIKSPFLRDRVERYQKQKELLKLAKDFINGSIERGSRSFKSALEKHRENNREKIKRSLSIVIESVKRSSESSIERYFARDRTQERSKTVEKQLDRSR